MNMKKLDIYRTDASNMGDNTPNKQRFVVEIKNKRNKDTSLLASLFSLEDDEGNRKENAYRKINNKLLSKIDHVEAELPRKSAVGIELREVKKEQLYPTGKKIKSGKDIVRVKTHIYNNSHHIRHSRRNRNLKKNYLR